MKYQYEDSIIKIIFGNKEDYITQITEYQEVREKAEYKVLYQKHQQEIKEAEIDELLNDIISKKPMRFLAKKYGKDFIKNWRSYREFASIVVLEETQNRALSSSILEVKYYNDYDQEDMNFALEELNELYDKR